MAWYNPSDPKQRNWMLAGLGMLVIMVPFYMYVVTPGDESNDEVRDRLESLDKQNRQAALITVQGGIPELEERMAAYQRHVARLEQLIPGQEEVAALLDDIQARARLVDVDVLSLAPEPTETAGPYNRTGYAMTVVGEYHSVARFLTEIASLSRIVTPLQVDVSVFPSPQTYDNMVSPVQASFRIETYVLPDASAVLPVAVGPEG